MIARSISVLLLAASVAGFDYFVSREDGKGVCVSNEREMFEKDLVPFFDLENGVFPEEREEKWTDGWRVRDLQIHTYPTTTIELDHKIVTTDGSEQFKRFIEEEYFGQKFLLLATNATLLWSENEDWRTGSTLRVHLNQRAHPDEERYETWAEICEDLGTKDEKCERLYVREDKTGGTDVLSQGRSWTFLQLRREGRNLILRTEHYQTLVMWNLKDIRWIWPKFSFARTNWTRGVFHVPLYNYAVGTSSENELSRTFSVGREGNLCLDFRSARKENGDYGRFELFNSSGGVEQEGPLVKKNWVTRLNFTLGRGGDFKLRLFNITDGISSIGACAGEFKVWSPSSGCYLYEGEWAFEKPPTAMIFSAKINTSLQVDLTEDQLREVCSALGVKPDDRPLKFSSTQGAAFQKCP